MPAMSGLLAPWRPDPLVVAGLVAAALGYARGWRARPVSRRRALAFGGGMTVLAVALLSPLETLAHELFAAHMAQHMLLIMAAAPLLAAAAPGLVVVRALPPAALRTLARARSSRAGRALRHLLTRPLPVLGMHVVALWAWHLPGPYQAALASVPLHAAEHASYLGTAWLFWSLVLGADAHGRSGRRALGRGPAVLYVFVTALQAGALGAVLTFARVALYPAQALGTAAWGLTPLQDQQLAGMLMWVPADLGYLTVAAVLFLRWLLAMERRAHEGVPG
jgi:putative membrane protein